MIRALSMVFLVFSLAGCPLFASDAPPPDNAEVEQDIAAQESDANGIIPEGGVTNSTQPVTPITSLPARNLYDQGLEELAVAHRLANSGKEEAASDVALQAYDNLTSVYVPRRLKKKRKKLYADRREAATLYVVSSMAYLENYAAKTSKSYRAIEETRARLADLRDVTISYPELNKRLTKALSHYSVLPSSSGPRAN